MDASPLLPGVTCRPLLPGVTCRPLFQASLCPLSGSSSITWSRLASMCPLSGSISVTRSRLASMCPSRSSSLRTCLAWQAHAELRLGKHTPCVSRLRLQVHASSKQEQERSASRTAAARVEGSAHDQHAPAACTPASGQALLMRVCVCVPRWWRAERHEAEARPTGQVQDLRPCPEDQAPQGDHGWHHGPAVVCGVQAQLPHARTCAQGGAAVPARLLEAVHAPQGAGLGDQAGHEGAGGQLHARAGGFTVLKGCHLCTQSSRIVTYAHNAPFGVPCSCFSMLWISFWILFWMFAHRARWVTLHMLSCVLDVE